MGGCCAKEEDDETSRQSPTKQNADAKGTHASERHKHNPTKRAPSADQQKADAPRPKPAPPMGVTHRVEPASTSPEGVSPAARNLVVPPPPRRGGDGGPSSPRDAHGAAANTAGRAVSGSPGTPARSVAKADSPLSGAVAAAIAVGGAPASPENPVGNERSAGSSAKAPHPQSTPLDAAVISQPIAAAEVAAQRQSPVPSKSPATADDAAAAPVPGVQPPHTAPPASALAAIIASSAAAVDAQRAVASAAAANDASCLTAADRPKLLEFDIKFDDDDLIVVDDMDEHAEVVEDFSVDDDSPERRGAAAGADLLVDKAAQESDSTAGPPHASTTVRPSAATGATVFDGLRMVKTTSPAADDHLRLDKKWFLDRGVVPPKAIVWSQTKRTVQIKIEPADAESGWELSKDGRVLDFTSTVGGKPIKVVLALLHPVTDLTSSLDEVKQVVTITATKAPVQSIAGDGDSDDEGEQQSPSVPYWTQLLQCSRRDYGALTFIRRELDDNEGDDDHGVPAYMYGSNPPVEAGGAFSEPEDD